MKAEPKKKSDSLYIRNIPENAVKVIRERAKDGRMSLAGVLIELLEKSEWI